MLKMSLKTLKKRKGNMKINWKKFLSIVIASVTAFAGLQQVIPELQAPIANTIMAVLLAAINALVTTKKEPKSEYTLPIK